MAETVVHSFVVPVYNEELVLREFYHNFRLKLIPYLRTAHETHELIFVNDGSTDATLNILKELHLEDPRHVVVLSLSRNFGHQIAITAGLDTARGDTVTVLDADLQDPIQVIPKLIDKWREGYDVVHAIRSKRKRERRLKKFTARLFYWLFRESSSVQAPQNAGDFRLMSRRAVSAINSIRERHRFLRGLAKWVGFKQASVYYEREPRYAGQTKYSYPKMFRLAWDAFSGFSLLPLRFATLMGFFAICVSLALAVVAIYSHYVLFITVPGWTSLVITILFMGSVQLICIGIMGEYVGRIFEQSKERPLYFIEEKMS